MKKEFEYMSRSEILGKIEIMQKSAHYLSTKFGVNHLLPKISGSDSDLSRKPASKGKTKIIKAQVHHNHPVLNDKNKINNNSNNNNQVEDNISIMTDFSTDLPAYVSRTEILKFYDQPAAANSAPPPLPIPAKNYQKLRQKSSKQNSEKSHYDFRPEFIPPPPPVIQRRLPSKKSVNIMRIHDSWSSRASSIINNPESIYVSRHELIQQINGSTPKQYSSKFTGARTHDSWSSRASSILAKAEEEPPYMSRTELLEKIALFGLGGSHLQQDGGRISSTSGENDDDDNESNASTVKNVVLVKKTEILPERQHQHYQQHYQTEDRHVKSSKPDLQVIEKSSRPGKPSSRESKEDQNQYNMDVLAKEDMYPVIVHSSLEYSDDACSCDSCNTYSDCSCCEHSNETGSDSSAETVVNGHLSEGEDLGSGKQFWDLFS